ncbi:MAG: hypothetical protein M1816_006023 [Peltula sp. TS41687]|nr:MAG: hypothetical protein M1816_006023 [Peltula sp. TS41687]
MAKGEKENSATCEASQAHFMYRQFFVTPPAVSPSRVKLAGQTGIVTGSNQGLGLEACRQLLALGLDHLILAVRDESKGRRARDDLAASAPGAKIEVWKLDLSSYESVIAFAQRCGSLRRLDFAILNAGVFKTKLEINPTTGHEEVMQVNYLSTMLLTILLLPVVQEKNSPSKPGRISIVGSETAAWCKFKEQQSTPILAAFNDPKLFERQERYYTSKLLGQLGITNLVKRVPSSVAIVNIVNPGFCHGSGLHREASIGVVGAIFTGVKRTIGRSTQIGARTLVDAALMHGPESHGRYLGDCQLKPMAPFTESAKGEEVGRRLWEETMAELQFANVQGILASAKQG